MWHHLRVRTAVCDAEAFYPLRSLVVGPFESLQDLIAIERFIRAVVLHDEIVMEVAPLWYDPENVVELTEEEERAGGRLVITAFAPVLDGYPFFTDYTGPARPLPNVELSAGLVAAATKYANAGEGNVYFDAAVEFLTRLVHVLQQGGSALVCGTFGQEIFEVAQRIRTPSLSSWTQIGRASRVT